MNSANILISSVIGFLFGVFCASFFDIASELIILIFIISPFFIIVFWKYEKIRYGALVLIFTGLGIFRFTIAENNFFNSNANANFPMEISLEAEVLDVQKREAKQVLIAKPVSGSMSFHAIALKKDDKIRVTTDNFLEYVSGEHVLLKGDLQYPENFSEEFDWRGYLAKEGIGYVMHRPDIEKMDKKNIGIRTITAETKNQLRKGIESSLLPPHSSLYKAMIIGDKTELNDKDRESLQRAGLSHIVAISGMHITIIIFTLVLFFVGAGFWRQHALYAAITVLVFYILIIGAPASASRAGIMAGVAIFAERSGRPNSGWRALLFAAALMVAFNPLLLRYDVGFQLSYLAVLGIILFSDRVLKFLQDIFYIVISRIFPGYITKDRPVISYGYERAISGLGGIISITVAAQIFTLPVVLYHFGNASPWSIFSNILVLPVLGYSLGAGFVSAAFGSVGGITATVIAAPAWMFSKYIWLVVSIFA